MSTPLDLRVHSRPLGICPSPYTSGEERVVRSMANGQAGSKTIALEGAATIYEASALREKLREALADGGDIRIDLGESGRWDLAGLQLMISAIKTGQSSGTTVRLLRVPKVCAEIAERSGLSDWLRMNSE
jgi:ABC-type transporter Mla MlaB component